MRVMIYYLVIRLLGPVMTTNYHHPGHREDDDLYAGGRGQGHTYESNFSKILKFTTVEKEKEF